MGLITFKKGHIGANLSAHNSFKSFIIFVFMLLMTTSGAMAEVIDGLNYDLNSKTKTAILLPKKVGKYSGNIVVPKKVKRNNGVEYVVTSLGDNCFYSCYDLTSIIIPSSVTSLGRSCFSYCTRLASITIPSSVTSLGNYCFSHCGGLTSITIPSSVTSLGDYCFRDCTGLTSITIPSSVTSLGRGCFFYCTRLPSITIPSSVTSLGVRCFFSCNSLKRMYFEGAKPEKISDASIFEECRIYVPAEYLQDYKNALGSQYRYIYSWDPNNPETNINQATTRGIVASAHDGIVSISGLDDGEVVKFYAADGKLIGSSSAVDGTASCAVSETMVIAKFGGNAIKVAVK